MILIKFNVSKAMETIKTLKKQYSEKSINLLFKHTVTIGIIKETIECCG
jgi:hypothetical protein